MRVLVTGCGPAGVATAIGLARAGLDVALLTGVRRRPRLEGLSTRTCQALRDAGCHSAADLAGEAPAQAERFVSWGAMSSAQNRESLVDRASLDLALERDARDAGVRVIDDSLLRIRREGPEPLCWRAETRAGGRLTAAYWVDARGRAAPRAPGGVQGPATVALAVACELTAGPPLASALVAVERGFVWVVVRERDAIAQWFCDARDRPGASSRTAEIEPVLAAVRATPGPSWLGGIRPLGATPYGRDATPRKHASPIGSFQVRVGDAAAATDPLSGQGVFNAVAMAGAAAACVRTQLERPDAGALVEAFYRDRVAAIYWRNGEKGRAFYREERRWGRSPFWARRASAIFAPPMRVPASPEVATRPVLRDGVIDVARVLLTPTDPEGVWRVAGVPVVELMEALAAGEPVAERFAATPQALETARAWLRSRGVAATSERKRGERLTTSGPIPQSGVHA